MRKEFAIQLYSVRDHMEKDYVGTLEKIAGMGYTAVEFAGFGGLSAAEMKGHLDRLGLTDRKSTRQNSSHIRRSRMPSSA